jgi:hydroxyacid-oxoacid transhydrogenase
MDFINAPVGKGLPITKTLSPLIAIPTTAGTGSETTGTAILDITSRSFKTGIANRALKPVLGIVVFNSPQYSYTTEIEICDHRTRLIPSHVQEPCK